MLENAVITKDYLFSVMLNADWMEAVKKLNKNIYLNLKLKSLSTNEISAKCLDFQAQDAQTSALTLCSNPRPKCCDGTLETGLTFTANTSPNGVNNTGKATIQINDYDTTYVNFLVSLSCIQGYEGMFSVYLATGSPDNLMPVDNTMHDDSKSLGDLVYTSDDTWLPYGKRGKGNFPENIPAEGNTCSILDRGQSPQHAARQFNRKYKIALKLDPTWMKDVQTLTGSSPRISLALSNFGTPYNTTGTIDNIQISGGEIIISNKYPPSNSTGDFKNGLILTGNSNNTASVIGDIDINITNISFDILIDFYGASYNLNSIFTVGILACDLDQPVPTERTTSPGENSFALFYNSYTTGVIYEGNNAAGNFPGSLSAENNTCTMTQIYS